MSADAEQPFAPMLATPSDSLPPGEDWVYEPKYDGVRIVAAIDGPQVALLSRNGNDKGPQFPEVRDALATLGTLRRAARLGALVLDGELVAPFAGSGSIDLAAARFEGVQGRVHATDRAAIARVAASAPARLVVFDCLLDGRDVLVHAPWHERRQHLERALEELPADDSIVQASLVTRGTRDAERLLERLRRVGAEGVIAKHPESTYTPGRRSSQWRKLKLEHQQEFVIGGYTPARLASRAANAAGETLGALLVGYFEDGRFRYAGRVGTGYTRAAGRALLGTLRARARKETPFDLAGEDGATRAELRDPAIRWTEPALVAEVRFNEWTSAGRLRQPVFLGVREDKAARDVRREKPGLQTPVSSSRSSVSSPKSSVSSSKSPVARTALPSVESQLAGLLAGGGDGVLRLPSSAEGSVTLPVTNLGKILIPASPSRVPRRAAGAHGGAITKAMLMQYYASVAPVLLPAIADRPLVLRRFPDGIDAPAFYQQQAPANVPPGVRVETVPDDGDGKATRRFVGGDLATLLYLVQLGAISVDPWHGRVTSDDAASTADYSIIDLDPGPAAAFTRVVQVARWVRAELDALGLVSIPKTSGATGLHVVVPLTPGTPADAARLLAELVATRVAERHRDEATVTRTVARRAPDAVYVDYLQNIRGKTVASVYSVRARAGGTVSTPLRWTEVTSRLDPTNFTIATVPRRLARVGDLWAEAFASPNDLGSLGD